MAADEPFSGCGGERAHVLAERARFPRDLDGSGHIAALETAALRVQAVRDPRGEVGVRVFRLGRVDEAMSSWSGTTDSAPVERQLELAPVPGPAAGTIRLRRCRSAAARDVKAAR